jgi:hypothetical protein
MRPNPAVPSRRLSLGSIPGIRTIILGIAILNLATSCSTTPQSEGALIGSGNCGVVRSMAGLAAGELGVASRKKRAAKPTEEEFKLREEGAILGGILGAAIGAGRGAVIGAGVRPSSRPKTRAVLENQSSGPISTLGHTITARPEARQPNRQPPADSPPSAPTEPKLPPQTAQQSVVPSTGETTRPPQKTSKD